MTNIFSSKATEALKASQADNAKLQEKVVDITAKLESATQVSQEFNTFKEAVKTDKAAFEAAMETMKNEFSAVINTLKDEVKTLTEAKAKVEVQAKVEVEKAKEEVKEKVNEQVAIKIASMAITEDKLPPVSKIEPLASIKIVRHGAQQSL